MAVNVDRNFVLFARKASHFMDENKLENATNLCEAGVRRFPFYPEGHFILGCCYEKAERMEDAKSEFERVLFYNNMHTPAMRHLAQIYRQAGLQEMAAEMLLREAMYNPNDERLHDLLRELNVYERFSNHFGGSQLIPPRAIEKKEPAGGEQLDDEALLTDEEEEPMADPQEESVPRRPKVPDVEHVSNVEDDFSTIMSEIFEDESREQVKEAEQEWMEVENLLTDHDEEVEQQKEIRPDSGEAQDDFPESTREHTEILLKELSRADAESEESAKRDVEEEADIRSAEPDDEGGADEYREAEEMAEKIIPESPDEPPARPFTRTFQTMQQSFPDEAPEEEKVTIEHLMKNPNLITPTFGEILIAQRKFAEARHVFVEMAKKDPNNSRLQKKINFLDRLLDAQSE